MKKRPPQPSGNPPGEARDSGLLILADGRILAHRLTRALAGVLAELNPADEGMARRAGRKTVPNDEHPNGD